MDFNTRTCRCWPKGKNLHQLCAERGFSLEDLLGAMDDRDDGEREREREREIGGIQGNPCRCSTISYTIRPFANKKTFKK